MHCNTLQHTATQCDTLQHTATWRWLCANHGALPNYHNNKRCHALQHSATLCNTSQRTATCCDALQHTATQCSTLQHAVMCRWSCAPTLVFSCAHCNALQPAATHCNTLQRTVTHCNTLQHTLHHPYTCQYVGVFWRHGSLLIFFRTAGSRGNESRNGDWNGKSQSKPKKFQIFFEMKQSKRDLGLFVTDSNVRFKSDLYSPSLSEWIKVSFLMNQGLFSCQERPI